MRCSILITAVLWAAPMAHATVLSLSTPPGVDPIVLPGGTLDVAVLAADNIDLSAVQIQLDLSQASDATVLSSTDIAAGDLFDLMDVTVLSSPEIPSTIIYLSDLFTEISSDGQVAVFSLTFPADAEIGTFAYIGFDSSATLITDGNDGGIRELIPVQTGSPLEIQIVPEPTGLFLMVSLFAAQLVREGRSRRKHRS